MSTFQYISIKPDEILKDSNITTEEIKDLVSIFEALTSSFDDISERLINITKSFSFGKDGNDIVSGITNSKCAFIILLYTSDKDNRPC